LCSKDEQEGEERPHFDAFFSFDEKSYLSQAGSSHADSEMEIDPPSPVVQGSSSRQQAKVYTQIKFQDNQEKEVYKLLKDKEFTSTLVVDPGLLHTIGMDSECQLIYRNIVGKMPRL
jgi:hypothetical protein